MAIAFADTALAMDRDRGRESWVIGLAGAALLAGWWTWASLASIPLSITAATARVEPSAGLVQLAWAEPATLTALPLAAGTHVTKGTVLASRDSGDLRRARDLAAAQLARLMAETERLSRELEAAALADSRAEAADAARVDAAELGAERSQLALEAVLKASARTKALATDGLASGNDAEKAESEAGLSRNANDMAVAELLRLQLDARAATLQRRADAAARTHREAELGLEIETARLTLQAAEAARAGADLRAPIDGTVSLGADYAPGAFVPAGAVIARLAPDGAMQIRASFADEDAVARLAPGQPAHLAVSGPLGTQSIALHVVSVVPSPGQSGAEAVLAPDAVSAALLPGLEGRLEVETGATTPLALLGGSLGLRGWATR